MPKKALLQATATLIMSPFPRYTSLCMPRHSCTCIMLSVSNIRRVIMATSRVDFASYTITEGLVVSVHRNAHCRLCTVGLRRTKRHCSPAITDQRGEFSGELVSIADIVYFSAAYKPVQYADSEWLCIGTKIKS